MADNFKFVQTQPFTTGAGGASIGDVTLILSSFLDINGVNLTMTDFGSVGFGTLEPSSGTNEEQISFTGVTQNGNGTATLTGVKTVLFKSPYTQTSGLAKTHAGGVTFVISNTAGFYDQLVAKNDDETIAGLYTFVQLPQSTAVPTVNADLTNKLYVDNTVISGAPNASTTVKGIVQLPSQAQTDAKTATGSTGAALAVTPDKLRATQYNDYVADTGSASTYAIAPSPTNAAYVTGQQFTFKAATANTANSGVSTLAVNGLAQKTIKKLTNVDLVVNDIAVGQIVSVVYDGTNFQMMDPVGNPPQLLASISTDATLGGSTPSATLYPSQNAVYKALYINSLITTTFETAGRFASLVSGGTNTFNTTGLLLDTTVTTTRCAGITWQIGPNGSGGDITANNPTFSAAFNTTTNGTAGSAFMGIGVPTVAGSGHTYTVLHAGFKILYTAGPTVTLYATQANGVTESASSALTTFASNDNVEVCFKINGTSSIDYYWRKVGSAWSSATNIATNMPSSSTSQFIQFSLANDSNATQNQLTFLGASYRR